MSAVVESHANVTSSSTSLTVSAPGKILLVGGYLVLTQENVGLVVAVNKRFYCTATIHRTEYPQPQRDSIQVVVSSPQFQPLETWDYSFDTTSGTLHLVTGGDIPAPKVPPRNLLLEKTLRVSLLYLFSSQKEKGYASNNTSIQSIHLEIKADNDFYSLWPHITMSEQQQQCGDWIVTALESLPRFLPAPRQSDDGQLLKTGMGSSACLVTSMVGALLLCHHRAITTTPSVSTVTTSKPVPTINEIANLAQICHCHAQGKIGSGFDVSAACFGSQIYQRFPPDLLQELLQALDSLTPYNTDIANARAQLLKTRVESTWTTITNGPTCQPFDLPPFLQVALADVMAGGTSSPSMARSILASRNDKDASNNNNVQYHWQQLEKINPRIITLLQQLHGLNPSPGLLQRLATTRATEWSSVSNSHEIINGENNSSHNEDDTTTVGRLLDLRDAFSEMRRHFKAMGQVTGGGCSAAGSSALEPDSQSQLADTTMELPGVVAALVPGAGGYDALACIYIDSDVVWKNLCKTWSTYTPSSSTTNDSDEMNDAAATPLVIATRVCHLTVEAAAGDSSRQGLRVESV